MQNPGNMPLDPEIYFENGVLRLENCRPEDLPEAAARLIRQDPRGHVLRAKACDYAPLLLELLVAGIRVRDHAKNFSPIASELQKLLHPRPHQARALSDWLAAGKRGIAALPTGAGKTILAVMAIAAVKRPALVLVPTIDLLQQWAGILEQWFGGPVGMLGGGSHQVEDLTVSTYDSAVLQMEFIGNRFGLLIADECHHLPGPVYRAAAEMAIAPYRLGLSATPESGDARDQLLEELLGPIVTRVEIDELEGKYLSKYRTIRLEIPLEPDEDAAYREHRATYIQFIRRNGVTFRNREDWGRFLMLCARKPEGKDVLAAFLEQRRIARGGRAKFRTVWELLKKHPGERTLIFTADNAAAYHLGRDFCLPVITHHTGARERKAFLDGFRQGIYPVLVTSKVLNEGIDVPEAAVGIVLSGSGSVREHVQRLGRILRPGAGKEQAILYELVSAGTSEEGVSSRRREHRAYQVKKTTEAPDHAE